ncbi:hypothetical protein DOY81_000023 [Sarcophaga bullata]|nr:hypothetical protein DOY81_000023 [Sarcophaga bullata]
MKINEFIRTFKYSQKFTRSALLQPNRNENIRASKENKKKEAKEVGVKPVHFAKSLPHYPHNTVVAVIGENDASKKIATRQQT